MKRLWTRGKLQELTAKPNKIGVSQNCEEYVKEYISFVQSSFIENINKNNKEDFIVGIDTANGATYKIAEEIFTKLGIKYKIIHNTPDGINIHQDCGSTHLDKIKKYVVDNKLSLGIAYDGDGDRCLAIDEKGNIIDGDILLSIFAKYLKEKNMLKQDNLVATVMSNLGLKKFAQDNNISLKQTKVGDRYVLEEMLKQGYNLGGEQSGHIILLDYNPTGDGIFTSLMLINILLEKNVLASKLCSIIKIYPQVLVNAKVNCYKKMEYQTDKEIMQKINQLEQEVANNGRILIRPSGTEPLVRVMIEGEDKEYITQQAKSLAELIENKLN